MAVAAQPSIGVRAGLNITSWDETGGSLDGDRRLRFVGGLTGQLPLYESAGARVEVLYAQKGSTIANGSVRYRADYLEVPLLLTGSFPLAPALRTEIEVGTAVALPLLGRYDLDPPLNTGGPGDPSDLVLEGDLNLQTDIGAVIGARLDVGPVGIGARYTYGLRNVIDDDVCPPDTPGSTCEAVPWKNRAFAITASLRVR